MKFLWVISGVAAVSSALILVAIRKKSKANRSPHPGDIFFRSKLPCNFEIRTSQGVLRGFRTSDGVVTFLGVPFAQSTAGENRTRGPQPLQWEGVKECVSHGGACWQDRNGARGLIENSMFSKADPLDSSRCLTFGTLRLPVFWVAISVISTNHAVTVIVWLLLLLLVVVFVSFLLLL